MSSNVGVGTESVLIRYGRMTRYLVFRIALLQAIREILSSLFSREISLLLFLLTRPFKPAFSRIPLLSRALFLSEFSLHAICKKPRENHARLTRWLPWGSPMTGIRLGYSVVRATGVQRARPD